MKDKLKQAVDQARVDIVAADAMLDQLQLDAQALQERKNRLEQDVTQLNQARQAAMMDKHDAKNSLALLARLMEPTK